MVFYTTPNGSTSYATRMTIDNTGAVSIPGTLSKGGGTFDITHPDPSMPKGSRLRHSFVESPTAGDNIYRWQIKVTKENRKFFIKLPKYWTHLNENPMVWVSSAEHPAASFGYVDTKQEKVIIQADRTGTYNVLLLGTRKDSLAAAGWKEHGMEYIGKTMGSSEKILSYQSSFESGEEAQGNELSEKKKEPSDLSLQLKQASERLDTEKKKNDKLAGELASIKTHDRASQQNLQRIIEKQEKLIAETDKRLRALETFQTAAAANANAGKERKQ
ncbi:MAG TPA: hypothetical protein PL169_18160 [Leptospiraceae bacterium]|nr:hypothetical protein [Leptospiraceae bacterium]